MAQTINGEGNPVIDVHFADGKLYPGYNITTRFSIQEKLEIQDKMITLVGNYANESIRAFGVQGLNIIKGDTQGPGNWLETDKVFADDIVCEIFVLLTWVNEREVIDTVLNHIAEELGDMIKTNGFCPSGRCCRLFQVYMFLRDYLDTVYMENANTNREEEDEKKTE